MTHRPSMSEAAAALKADVAEMLRAATGEDLREATRSSFSSLAARLVMAAKTRDARVEQLVVAIKEGFTRLVRPSGLEVSVWNAMSDKLVSDCINAYFATARRRPASAYDKRRVLPR